MRGCPSPRYTKRGCNRSWPISFYMPKLRNRAAASPFSIGPIPTKSRRAPIYAAPSTICAVRCLGGSPSARPGSATAMAPPANSGAAVAVDVSEFERLVAQAEEAAQKGASDEAIHDLEQAMALYRGPLLPDCYEEWVLMR